MRRLEGGGLRERERERGGLGVVLGKVGGWVGG